MFRLFPPLTCSLKLMSFVVPSNILESDIERSVFHAELGSLYLNQFPKIPHNDRHQGKIGGHSHRTCMHVEYSFLHFQHLSPPINFFNFIKSWWSIKIYVYDFILNKFTPGFSDVLLSAGKNPSPCFLIYCTNKSFLTSSSKNHGPYSSSKGISWMLCGLSLAIVGNAWFYLYNIYVQHIFIPFRLHLSLKLSHKRGNYPPQIGCPMLK